MRNYRIRCFDFQLQRCRKEWYGIIVHNQLQILRLTVFGQEGGGPQCCGQTNGIMVILASLT